MKAALTPDGVFDNVRQIGYDNQKGSSHVKVPVDFYGGMSFGDAAADFRKEGIPAMQLPLQIAVGWHKEETV